MEENGFQFEQKIDNNLPPLSVDREAIARSLLNLVSNAVKYSAGRKNLGVHLSRGTENVIFGGGDQGVSVPPRRSLRFFRSFIVSATRWYITPRGVDWGSPWCATLCRRTADR